ncbi:hypothetical protein [Yersinia kristensenii]|uniref:hypothetical protein n=1 Tax=Yersinia kristensenii TaxID=28152 RepID=UPI001FE7ED85|nr:hypothetical protein [Yersinia kristensenii]
MASHFQNTTSSSQKSSTATQKKITALPPKTFPAKRWLSYYVRQIDKEIRGQL